MSQLKEKIKNNKTKYTTVPHLIIIARAGTGKTTTLVEGLKVMRGEKSKFTPSPQQDAIWESMKLSKDAKSVTFCCFNKSIQRELERRVPEGCEARTMHSIGNGAITAAYGRLKLESGRTQSLLAEIIGVDVWDLRKKHKTLLAAVDTLVGLCKVNLLEGTEEDLDWLTSHHLIETNGLTARIYELVPEVLKAARNVEEDRMMDFNDMIWLPIVNNLPIPKRDLLLVDEAQDLNKCQQALAMKAGKRLIFCGDDRQAIYGFAGADSQSLSNLEAKLGNPTVLPLTVTRRCGKSIVEEARKVVPDFEAHEDNGEGTITELLYDDEEGVDVYHKAVEDGDMVLSRVNAPLVQQCFKFIKEGRKANIQGRDIGKGLISTIKKMKAIDAVDLIGKLEDWFEMERRKENKKKFPSDTKLAALDDRQACIVCFTEGCKTVDQVTAKIDSVFTDDQTNGILLSSIHKAKGLEADRVFLFNHKDAPIPHPMAKTEWEQQQEKNLLYVGITRAIKELVYVH